MRKVVITGGAGFIGSHLAEALAGGGYHVTALDDLSTSNSENIAELSSQDNVDFVEGSVTDLPLLQRLFQGVDYAFHLAAISSVSRSIDAPAATHEVNITGTLNVLLAARNNRVKKVIHASSCSVYGDTPALPKREDMLPNPQSPYSVTKLAAEHYGQVFSQVYGLPTICLRYFNIYGPRQDPYSEYAAVIPNFIKKVSQGEAPIIFGDGDQTRDFTFVKDVVAASILSAESSASGIFNIGNGESTTINELAHLIIKLVGSTVTPIYQSPRPGDIRHSLADISRARKFGYNPKYNLEEGLKETIRHLIP